MGLIWSIIMGALAGAIATGIMNEKSSWIKILFLEFSEALWAAGCSG